MRIGKKWTYEKCKEEALKYNNKKEVKDKVFYRKINKEKWFELVDHFIEHKRVIKNTYEVCKSKALEYNNRTMLYNEYPSIYKKIHDNEWYELIEHMPNLKWTYEKCKEEALKYTSVSEFMDGCSGAYWAINRNKWSELKKHLSSKYKQSVKWTYEKCKEVVLGYIGNGRKDFAISNSSAYKAIYLNNWKHLLELIPTINNPMGYWTYDVCKEEALKYETITEFRKNNGGGYYRIRESKWFELYDHMKNVGHLYKRLIYVYEFDDNHCYVGLTCDINRRKYQHLNEKSSGVYQHTIETKLTPNLIIKTDYIDVDDAILLESEYLEEYEKNGWVTLNKHKTGSTGSSVLYWNREKCIEEVKKHKTYSDFRKCGKGAFNSIVKNKWYDILEENIDGYTHRQTSNKHHSFYWTRDKCIEEAKKHKTYSDFRKYGKGSINSIDKNGWYDILEENIEGYEYKGKKMLSN